MNKSGRISIFAGIVALAIGLIVFTVMAFLRTNPPVIDFTADHQPGQPIHLTVQTVGAIGATLDPTHPTWVSYLAVNPTTGKWEHSTLWKLPAHTKVDVTLYEFDSGSPLRNEELGLVTGVEGNRYLLNGTQEVGLANSYAGYGVAHTFSIPSLGINVPLLGVNGTASTFCSVPAPCPLSAEHNTITFSFTTPGPGQYRFQCFIPCGLAFLYGNGGPMSTIGYMGGFLEVV